MLFTNGNDFDISSVWGSSKKKNPCLDKIWRKGKGKGAEFKYRLGERRTLLGGGVGFQGEGRLDQLSLTTEPSLS